MNLEQNIMQIPIEDIIPNRFQPRLAFDDRGLEELANSIKQHGIIQPLVLRRVNDKFEIIAGERRYKAATLAGLSKVPAVIANIDDNKSAEVAIVENVQRRDLTPIEEARSYKNLLDKGYLTQAELAKKMGISQSAIANKLRLLNLDSKVQDALLNNQISERHARSLLVLASPEEQREWLDRIIKERMTVRELDEALKKKSTEDDTDIPLVRNLDIDAIKKEATELPSISEDSDIARKLAEIEREKMYNPDIVRVDQASNNSKSNFFNFLENETVNMNTEDISLKTPAIDFELPTMNKEEKPEPKEPEEIVPEEELPVTPVELPNKDTEEKSIFNSNFGTPPTLSNEETNNDNDDNFDPINLIETLDPNYETKVEEQMGLNLKTAITAIRDTKDTLSDKGFKLNMEETDLPDSYQFIIKIKKN